MALKYSVPSLDDVEEAHRQHYIADEAGGFKLDLEGYESASELREAKRRERDLKHEAKAKLRELEAAQSGSGYSDSDADYAFAESQAALAKKIPPSLRAHAYGSPEYLAALAALDAEYSASHTAKLREATAGQQAQVDSMRADLARVTLERVALYLAAKLARPGCAPLLIPHIAARLVGREENGAFVVGVKDAASLEALAEQFRNDVAFVPIIHGTSPTEKALHHKRVAETLGVKPPTQPLTRAKFEQLSPELRASHVRAGAQIFDIETKESTK
jgi:hypothetical protein